MTETSLQPSTGFGKILPGSAQWIVGLASIVYII